MNPLGFLAAALIWALLIGEYLCGVRALRAVGSRRSERLGLGLWMVGSVPVSAVLLTASVLYLSGSTGGDPSYAALWLWLVSSELRVVLGPALAIVNAAALLLVIPGRRLSSGVTAGLGLLAATIAWLLTAFA